MVPESPPKVQGDAPGDGTGAARTEECLQLGDLAGDAAA